MRKIIIGEAPVLEEYDRYEPGQEYEVSDELAAKFCALGWAHDVTASEDETGAVVDTTTHEVAPNDATMGTEG